MSKIGAGFWAESEHVLLQCFFDRPSALAQGKPILAHVQCLWSAVVQALQNHSVKLSVCLSFIFLPLMLLHRSQSCPLLTFSPRCLASLVARQTFSFLCLAFASAFIKLSPYICCFVSWWFSAFMSFKCSLFLSTGNVRSSSLVSFGIDVQTAVYTGQVQEKLNSSICWKQLCTCSSL